MAQQFKDREKRQFFKELENVLDAITELKKTEIVRLNEERLNLITKVIRSVDDIKTNFNNSLLN